MPVLVENQFNPREQPQEGGAGREGATPVPLAALLGLILLTPVPLTGEDRVSGGVYLKNICR